MSREEAAIIYLDNLLGFHGRFNSFQEAERRLSEQEKKDIEIAVLGMRRKNC